jgi:hypothetical protein
MAQETSYAPSELVNFVPPVKPKAGEVYLFLANEEGKQRYKSIC